MEQTIYYVSQFREKAEKSEGLIAKQRPDGMFDLFLENEKLTQKQIDFYKFELSEKKDEIMLLVWNPELEGFAKLYHGLDGMIHTNFLPAVFKIEKPDSNVGELLLIRRNGQITVLARGIMDFMSEDIIRVNGYDFVIDDPEFMVFGV